MDKYHTADKKEIEPIIIDKALTPKEFQERLNKWAFQNYGIKSTCIITENKTLREKIIINEKKTEKEEERTIGNQFKKITETDNVKTKPYEMILKEYMQKLDEDYFDITGDKIKRVNNY